MNFYTKLFLLSLFAFSSAQAALYEITDVNIGKSRCYFRSYPENHMRNHPNQKISEIAILLHRKDEYHMNARVAARWPHRREVLSQELGCGTRKADNGVLSISCETDEETGFKLRPHSREQRVVMDVLSDGFYFWDNRRKEVNIRADDQFNNAYSVDLANVETCERLLKEVPAADN